MAIDGETMETVRDFILGGYKITADVDCSNEIKRHLLLWRKAMNNLDNILKSRDVTLPTVPSSQSYGFPSSRVWTWGMDYKESWTLNNWCFWTWYWRRLLRVPWTARRSKQSILKEIHPEYSLEGLILKLKLQSFGYLMRRTDSRERPWCWERWKAGGEGNDRGWDSWMSSPTQWTWVWVN